MKLNTLKNILSVLEKEDKVVEDVQPGEIESPKEEDGEF